MRLLVCLCFVDLELVVMRFLDIKFILVLLNLVAICGSYYVVIDVPLNKGNLADIFKFVLVLGNV
jgi:hypothetical protein